MENQMPSKGSPLPFFDKEFRHFVWRFNHNRLPMRMNIARRGIELDTRRAVCHRPF
jgi:hypothetical protein